MFQLTQISHTRHGSIVLVSTLRTVIVIARGGGLKVDCIKAMGESCSALVDNRPANRISFTTVRRALRGRAVKWA